MSSNLFTILISVFNVIIILLISIFIIKKASALAQSATWFNRLMVSLSSLIVLCTLLSTVWYYAAIYSKQQQAIPITEQHYPDLRAIADDGQLENHPDAILNSSFTLHYAKSELTLSDSLLDTHNTVFVKTVPSTGNDIKVSWYMRKAYFGGVDITKQIRLPKPEIIQNSIGYTNLNLFLKNVRAIKNVNFALDPTVVQFIHNSTYLLEPDFAGATDYQYTMLVTVPAHIKVNDPNHIAFNTH